MSFNEQNVLVQKKIMIFNVLYQQSARLDELSTVLFCIIAECAKCNIDIVLFAEILSATVNMIKLMKKQDIEENVKLLQIVQKISHFSFNFKLMIEQLRVYHIDSRNSYVAALSKTIRCAIDLMKLGSYKLAEAWIQLEVGLVDEIIQQQLNNTYI